MSVRSDVEKFIIKQVNDIVGNNSNEVIYKDMFSKMTDAAFERFMDNLRTGKTELQILSANDAKIKLDVERNLKIAKRLGLEFFQHITVHNDKPYKTPEKYLIYKLPTRRVSQLLTKKISIPKDNKSIDMTTGQVTGKSKASKLTMPEIQILSGLGLKDSVVELMKIRGGDLGANAAMNNILIKNGSVSQKALEAYSTGVVSTKTLKMYFYAMHIKNNL